MRYFRYLAGFKLTPFGRILIFLTFFAGIGSITVEIPIYQMFCALFFLPTVVEAIGTLVRPLLSVRCQAPGRATVGVPIRGVATVENCGHFTAFDLMIGFFGIDRSIEHLQANRVVASLQVGNETEIPFELLPSRRGRFSLVPVNVHSTFPFNLMRFGSNEGSLPTLTVLAAYQSLDHFEVPLGNCGRPMHPAPLLGAKGESPEYVGNREYVLGEAAVRLDFRAWARLGRPVVREYQDEFSFRSALILDTWQPETRRLGFHNQAAEQRESQLEAAVSLSSAIAESMQAREIVIDLFVAGPEIYLFQSSHSGTRLDTLQELFATVETASTDAWQVLPEPLMESLETISSIVFVLLDWDHRRQELIERIRETGRGVRVLLVRSTPTTDKAPAECDEFQTIAPPLILSGGVRSL